MLLEQTSSFHWFTLGGRGNSPPTPRGIRMPQAADGRGQHSKKFLEREQEKFNAQMKDKICPNCPHPLSQHGPYACHVEGCECGD